MARILSILAYCLPFVKSGPISARPSVHKNIIVAIARNVRIILTVDTRQPRLGHQGQESKMTTTTKIVWNGCDGYMDIDSVTARFSGYNIERNEDGTATLYTPRESFESFAVVEIDEATVPTDEDGLAVLDGLYVTDDFRVWKPV